VPGTVDLRRLMAPSVPRFVRRAWYALRRLTLRASRHARRRGDPSLFGTLVDEREAWLHAHLPHEVARYQCDIITKARQKEMAVRLGLPVARPYLTGVPLDAALAFVEDRALERFVVKPNLSRSGIGCKALVARDGGYLDLKRGLHGSLASHRRDLLRAYEPLGRDDDWIVEELLLPVDGGLRSIDDFKLYCFGGRVELIVHKRAGTGGADNSIYTRDWRPVNVGMDDRDALVYQAPLNGRRLVEFAERAAGQLFYPFIRVDVYDSSRGVVLGEFTPGPGRRYRLNEEWNAIFVQRWHEAAEALIEGLRSGAITPLGPPPGGEVVDARETDQTQTSPTATAHSDA
jgi:hypothetical protein